MHANPANPRPTKPHKQNININTTPATVPAINTDKQDMNELQLLLKTNKILINNKKNIYQTKISTYDRQMEKIRHLLNATVNGKMERRRVKMEKQKEMKEGDREEEEEDEDQEEEDLEEREALMDKLRSIEVRKQQAIAKLQAIEAIQKDIKAAQTQKTQPLHKTNLNQSQPLTLTLTQTLTQQQQIPHKQLNPTIKLPKMPIPQKQNIAQQPIKKVKQKLKENSLSVSGKQEKQWRIKEKQGKRRESIRSGLAGGDRKQPTNHNKYYLIDSQNKQQLILWSQPQNHPTSPPQPFNPTPTPNPTKNHNKSLHPPTTPISIKKDHSAREPSRQISISNIQAIVQQQYWIILEEIGNILEVVDQGGVEVEIRKDWEDSVGINNLFQQIYQNLQKLTQTLKQTPTFHQNHHNHHQTVQSQLQQKQNLTKTITHLKQQQTKISEELHSIQKQCELYCTRIEDREKQYWDIMGKIQEGELCWRKVESGLGEVQKEYREIYQAITLTDRQSSRSNPTPHPTLPQLHQHLRSTLQSQKLSLLQNKQTLLSQQYQIGLLKGDEKRLENKCKELMEKIQKLVVQGEDTGKEVVRLGKERDRIGKVLEELGRDVEQYENLLAIRKNSYETLETKYQTLKQKKQKSQKSQKTLQQTLSQLQQKSTKLDQYIQKRQQILQTINEQIRSKLREKQQLITDIEQCEGMLAEKEGQLVEMEEKVRVLVGEIGGMEGKLGDVEGRVRKLGEVQLSKAATIQQKQQQIDQLLLQITQHQQTLTTLTQTLTITQSQLSQTQSTVQSLQSQSTTLQQSLTHQSQSHKQLLQNSTALQQQIKNLQQIRESLQESVGVLLMKKEEAVMFVDGKYGDLEKMEEIMGDLGMELEELGRVREGKLGEVGELGREVQRLGQERDRLEKENAKNALRLQNVLSLLQQNRDEQQNLQQRIKKYKQIESKILLQIAVRVFSSPSSSSSFSNPDQTQPHLPTLLPEQTKQQIEHQLQQLKQARKIKQLYEKQKQENRRLKLDNQRLKKIYQMEMEVQVDFEGSRSEVRSRSRIQSGNGSGSGNGSCRSSRVNQR